MSLRARKHIIKRMVKVCFHFFPSCFPPHFSDLERKGTTWVGVKANAGNRKTS
jgi:hypothetical protein